MRTPKEQVEWEVQCYGKTEAELIAEKPPLIDHLMYAMGILSDAQHLLDRYFVGEESELIDFQEKQDMAELIRQYINKSKFWMGRSREHLRRINQTMKVVMPH